MPPLTWHDRGTPPSPTPERPGNTRARSRTMALPPNCVRYMTACRDPSQPRRKRKPRRPRRLVYATPHLSILSLAFGVVLRATCAMMNRRSSPSANGGSVVEQSLRRRSRQRMEARVCDDVSHHPLPMPFEFVDLMLEQHNLGVLLHLVEFQFVHLQL